MKKSVEKITNTNTIYSYIYSHHQCSQKDLVIDLGLSMPTVTKNLQSLVMDGLIEKDGFFQSDGGRKASIISCCSNAKIAIGIEVLKNSIHIVAINLYGEIIKDLSIESEFVESDAYYLRIHDAIDSLIKNIGAPNTAVLGVGIAIQGIISSDGHEIVYGEIMNNKGMTVEHFSKYTPYPCILIHDAKASIIAENWFKKVNTAIYIGLNLNIGSSFLIDGKVRSDKGNGECCIEHMCLVPSGKKCYCGKQGCFEKYCSGEQLQEQSGMKIETFFHYLRQNDERCLIIWKDYLHNLALALNNTHFIVDVPIILGGLISSYLIKEDYIEIDNYIHEIIHGESIQVVPAYIKNHSAAIGAALQYIQKFIENFR